VDLFGAVQGVGSYEAVEKLADTIECDGFELRVLSIEGLIITKRATGRPKDEAGLIELEALREARDLARDDSDDLESH
jgi:predicted nucleotidyltransferase